MSWSIQTYIDLVKGDIWADSIAEYWSVKDHSNWLRDILTKMDETTLKVYGLKKPKAVKTVTFLRRRVLPLNDIVKERQWVEEMDKDL